MVFFFCIRHKETASKYDEDSIKTLYVQGFIYSSTRFASKMSFFLLKSRWSPHIFLCGFQKVDKMFLLYLG